MGTIPHTTSDKPQSLCARAWVPILLGVWALSLALRLAFASQVVGQNTPEQIHDLNWDSREYVHLAQTLAEAGRYGADTDESRFFALLRTPGYPAFCAAVFKLGGGIRAIVYAQAVLGSLVPVLVTVLAGLIFRSRAWAGAAGTMAALSTTGIGLSGILLTDLPFALAFLAGFVALALAAAHGWRGAAPASALCFAAAVLFKPALLYVGPFLALAWWLLARSQGRPVRWGALACVLLVPLLAMAGWAARNHARTGQWVYSTVDAQNLRHFLAPFTEELAAGGWPADPQRARPRHEEAMVRDLRQTMSGRISPTDLAVRQRAEAREIIARHPLWAATAMATSATVCTNDGWSYFPAQLKQPTALRAVLHQLNLLQIGYHLSGLGLALLVAFESRLRRRLPGGAGGALAPVDDDAGDPAGDEADPARRAEGLGLAACAVVFVYFFAIAGTSFSTGFRIMYPVEFAMILLTLGGARAAVRLAGALARDAALGGDAAAPAPLPEPAGDAPDPDAAPAA